jgi:hypothetical protein
MSYLWIKADDGQRHVVVDSYSDDTTAVALCKKYVKVIGFLARGRNCDTCTQIVDNNELVTMYHLDDSDFQEENHG